MTTAPAPSWCAGKTGPRLRRTLHPRHAVAPPGDRGTGRTGRGRSEEHTSELQSLMRISYAVFCLKKKKKIIHKSQSNNTKQYTTHTTRQSYQTTSTDNSEPTLS